MKAGEITRIAVFSVLGAGIMFFVQPWVYENRIIRISDVSPDVWLEESYTSGAITVFAVSVISTLIWYLTAAKARVKGSADVERWRLFWWIFLLLPIASICIAIGFFNQSQDALLSLTALYIFDIILVFWLPTATSSPGLLMYLPPGAFILRRLLGA
ncbi:hypothetical protein G7B40_029165 [Aetokthonos hydrillicola Thurmond2011]|uniref:Uncharacterized protein n=1 Tax=Aetokthonos hydrillicola Thurmond2011 TaxID=2712845 RepID=A0AAP5IBS1_9CYAN|nr:hypothetical protein [Aetokthonos hydrillicola]MBO3463175.1 hypothetical protein [Aetokthonos hydrillicola CCALA 1050]MBW4584194.1 hypothetical protein [Aetokthonos hydrillicola CCALA 1050]MDR9898598.1 hypothetical protein [Aetokthonos hydrillicola Thurmond2011]